MESLALSADGAELLFTSHLLLRGEENRTSPTSRMYRHAFGQPAVEITAPNSEQFDGAYLATDNQTVAQYCRRAEAAPRPIFYDGVCLTRAGQRSFYRGGAARLSRNGRYLFLRDTAHELLDLDSGERYRMPEIPVLHTHNALSDTGTLVTYFLNPSPNPRTAALTRPGAPQRLVYEGNLVTQAAISPDGNYVFLRADSEDRVFSLIEIEIATGARRTVYQTHNDHFTFSLDRGAGNVMIRHYQAISIWDRAANTIRRLVDSPDLILSAIMSDDGGTIAYQRNSGSIIRVRTTNGLAEELYGEAPSALIPRGNTAFPGSAVFFTARGFNAKTEIAIVGQPAPILRLEPELLLQIPWELPLQANATVYATNPNSPFLLRVEVLLQKEPTPAFFNYFDPAAQSFMVSAALEDFSALASSRNPAPAGSTIHAYLGALGPLDQSVGTGQPGPANPPAKPLAQITCELRNIDTNSEVRQLEIPALTYAPGLIGTYQADITIPADWPSGVNQLRCRSTPQSGDETRLFTKAR